MRALIRTIRDSSLVLTPLVVGLRVCRSLGFFRGRRFFEHVPYRGVVSVDCNDGDKFVVRSYGGQIENGLYWEGLYSHEPMSMRRWVDLAASARTVLDIGANSGIFSLAAAAAGAGRIHAFEPVPRVHQILVTNVELNGMDNVVCSVMAVGEQVGDAEIFDPGGDAPTSASISAEFADSHFGNNIASYRVPVTSIDQYCAEHGICDVDLVKIDVEGHEEFALKGMQETVRTSQPAILMEVLEEYEAELHELTIGLFGTAYDWHRIDEGTGEPNRNVMLLPKSKA